jgi:hypothetical protein
MAGILPWLGIAGAAICAGGGFAYGVDFLAPLFYINPTEGGGNASAAMRLTTDDE